MKQPRSYAYFVNPQSKPEPISKAKVGQLKRGENFIDVGRYAEIFHLLQSFLSLPCCRKNIKKELRALTSTRLSETSVLFRSVIPTTSVKPGIGGQNNRSV